MFDLFITFLFYFISLPSRVIAGKNRNAFCAVRPPGHHAGPRGLVTCANDMAGSHGFCLLNNVVSFYFNILILAETKDSIRCSVYTLIQNELHQP